VPPSTASLVCECLCGLAAINFTGDLAVRIGPLLLRIAVFCLSQSEGQFDQAALLLVRKLLTVPDRDQVWESVQHALLVSLASLAPRPVVLQASVVVFSSLSFAHPNLAVYRVLAKLFAAAFSSDHAETRITALTCFPCSARVFVSCARIAIVQTRRVADWRMWP
jgi:hypothetical protein